MTTAEETHRLIRKLSTLERKEAKDLISLLDREAKLVTRSGLKPSQIMARDESMWVSSLLEALTLATIGSRLHSRPSDRVLATLQDSFAPVALFVKSSGLHRTKSYERKAVYDMLAEMVVSYSCTMANHVGVPLGPRFILQNIDKIPGLFDRAYPGYAEAGLAGMVLDQRLLLARDTATV